MYELVFYLFTGFANFLLNKVVCRLCKQEATLGLDINLETGVDCSLNFFVVQLEEVMKALTRLLLHITAVIKKAHQVLSLRKTGVININTETAGLRASV